MTIKLAHIIQSYVDSSNRHDVQSILSTSQTMLPPSTNEAETLRGKKAIEDWITKTLEKYNSDKILSL